MPNVLHGIEDGISAGTRVYSSEALAVFAAFTTPPTAARKNTIDDCIAALKTASIWTKLDVLYAFAAADSQAALINWKNPGTFNGTLVNTPAFTADQGFLGNGSTNYISTGFNPSTATTPNYVRDSAAIFGWSLTTTDIAAAFMGYVTSTNLNLTARTSNTQRSLINSAASADTYANTDGTGFYSASRTGASATQTYKTGASVGSGTTASAAVQNEAVILLRRTTTYWSGRLGIAGLGSQLSSGEHLSLYNAVHTYMQVVAGVA